MGIVQGGNRPAALILASDDLAMVGDLIFNFLPVFFAVYGRLQAEEMHRGVSTHGEVCVSMYINKYMC